MATSAFHIVLFVFVLMFVGMMTLGFLISFRTLGKAPLSKIEMKALAVEARSPWNPWGKIGGTRWRYILFSLFILLVALNFVRA
jgi:hypothetical protein